MCPQQTLLPHYSQHILSALPSFPSHKIFSSSTKMAADSADKRPIRAPGTTASHSVPKTLDPLPCPRCESTTTKFCYYNNYNLAQPRYFCKSCRRYWTHGGTLRNVPIGGGTRKNSKRSRPPSSVSAPSPVSTTSSSAPTPEPESLPVSAHSVSAISAPGMSMSDVNLNEAVGGGEPGNGGFASFMGNPGNGYLSLGGYGFGVGSGSGYDSVWGFQGNGYMGGFPSGNGSSIGCNSWGMAAAGDIQGDGGLNDENCFSWPGLAISAHAKGLK